MKCYYFSFLFSSFSSSMVWYENNSYFYPILHIDIVMVIVIICVSFMRMDLNRYGIDQTRMDNMHVWNREQNGINNIGQRCVCVYSVQENSNIKLTFVIWKWWKERHSSHIRTESNRIPYTKIRFVGLLVNKTHVLRFRIDFTFTNHHMV